MDVHNVRHYGATGAGGNTNDRPGIEAAIAACRRAGGGTLYFPAGTYRWTGTIELPGNMWITGDGHGSLLQPDDARGEALGVVGDHLVISHVRIAGSALVAVAIRNGAQDILLRSVMFEGTAGSLGHCVLLFECSRVLVQDCAFHACGYGVIQQSGSASSSVRVSGCTVTDSYGDFVECNSATVDSRDWMIDHNRYLGSKQTGPEERFVGVTRVENVTISDNHVYGVGGDAAVHLEGALGNVRITNNHFENCRTSGGNVGYVYVTDSAKTLLIQGNVFTQTDPALPMAFAVDTSNSAIAPRIAFAGNRVVAGARCAFGGLNLGFNHGTTDIQGNEFNALQVAVRANSAQNVRVADNDVLGCVRGISTAPDGPSGSGGTGFMVRGNRFIGTGESCIDAGRNAAGTGAPTGWLICDNVFDATVSVRDGVDILASGNFVGQGVSFAVSAVGHGGGARVVERATFLAGSGLRPGT